MRAVIDIETLPAPVDCEVWRAMVERRHNPGTYRPPRHLTDPIEVATHRDAYIAGLDTTKAAARLKTALNGMVGRVACIGLAIEQRAGTWQTMVIHPPVDEPAAWGTLESEAVVFDRLVGLFDRPKDVQWVGWNLPFDIGFLRTRGIRHARPDLIHLFGDLDAKPWATNTVDLQRYYPSRSMWSTYGARLGDAWMSANGTVDPDATGGGAMVWQMVENGQLDQVVAHCRHDVEKTAQLWDSLAPHLSGDLFYAG